MSAVEARAWWADVEEVRARIEERRQSPGAERPVLRSLDGGAAPRAAQPRNGREQLHPRRRTAPHTTAAISAPAPRSLVLASHRPSAPRPAPRAVARPDRVALWAVLLGALLLFICVGSAGAATTLGDRTLKAPMDGRDVRHLQAQLKQLGMLQAPATAHFGTLTRGAVKRFQRSRCLTVDGIAGPATIRAIVSHAPRCAGGGATSGGTSNPDGLTRTRTVTWFGPGLYGRSTACGQTLTSKLVGVAHRTLPCGTRVTLAYQGRVVRAAVVDRGPYTDGVQYDLTWATARRLGVLSAGRASVRSSH